MNNLTFREYQNNDATYFEDIIRKAWQYDLFCSKEVSAKMTRLYLLGCLSHQTFTLVMVMVLIQSSYSMVDGIFISNILGDKSLSSLTLISPYFNFFMAIATMFSAGGSAIVMKKMGEKNNMRQSKTSQCY